MVENPRKEPQKRVAAVKLISQDELADRTFIAEAGPGACDGAGRLEGFGFNGQAEAEGTEPAQAGKAQETQLVLPVAKRADPGGVEGKERR